MGPEIQLSKTKNQTGDCRPSFAKASDGEPETGANHKTENHSFTREGQARTAGLARP